MTWSLHLNIWLPIRNLACSSFPFHNTVFSIYNDSFFFLSFFCPFLFWGWQREQVSFYVIWGLVPSSTFCCFFPRMCHVSAGRPSCPAFHNGFCLCFFFRVKVRHWVITGCHRTLARCHSKGLFSCSPDRKNFLVFRWSAFLVLIIRMFGAILSLRGRTLFKWGSCLCS